MKLARAPGSVRRKRSFDRGLVARHTQLLNTLHRG
jgi:hypothetical protein